jgi:thiamine-monophosphate kinase
MDLSDGLLSDLPRLAGASGCGAVVEVEKLPLSAALQQVAGAEAWQRALGGGEDYELCFTAAPRHADQLRQIAAETAVPLRCCGVLRAAAGLELRSRSGVIQFSQSPFDHFGNRRGN